MGEYYSGYEHAAVIGDGDRLVARFHDFKSLDESPSGYGYSDAEALANLVNRVRGEQAAELAALREQVARLRRVLDRAARAIEALSPDNLGPTLDDGEVSWPLGAEMLYRFDAALAATAPGEAAASPLRIDAENGVAYLTVRPGVAHGTYSALSANVNIDVDADGHVVGVEVMDWPTGKADHV